jgi:hypothetical protein
MMGRKTQPALPDPGVNQAIHQALLWASFPYFLAEILGPAGRRLQLAPHVLAWAGHLVAEPRLVLLAPRGHGKTTLVLAYIAWCFWRHGRDRSGRPLVAPEGSLQVVLFSATREQVLVLMSLFRDLLDANRDLFPELPEAGSAGSSRTRWSQAAVRLVTGAELLVRAYQTSTRGLHPDILVLDDVLNDANSLTGSQRTKTWRHFLGTLLPMAPRRLIVIGTAIHQRDLLHQLADGIGFGPDPGHSRLGFSWIRYAALDEETGEALWPEAYPSEQLRTLRDVDPPTFSREYQNRPRDDAASMFPHELTQRALDAGAAIVLGAAFPAAASEVVLLGADFALSEAAGADFTVIFVAAFDQQTQQRRVLDVRREKGLDFAAQVALIRDLVERHRVTLGVVEQNSFQRWIVDELARWPETHGRIFGHTTGIGKGDPRDGVPRLKLELLAGSWVMPSGDAVSLRLARAWQEELAAFGMRDGRLAGVGEHDDLVIASWYIELAVLQFLQLMARARSDEIVTAEDLGIERVRIGEPYM